MPLKPLPFENVFLLEKDKIKDVKAMVKFIHGHDKVFMSQLCKGSTTETSTSRNEPEAVNTIRRSAKNLPGNFKIIKMAKDTPSRNQSLMSTT